MKQFSWQYDVFEAYKTNILDVLGLRESSDVSNIVISFDNRFIEHPDRWTGKPVKNLPEIHNANYYDSNIGIFSYVVGGHKTVIMIEQNQYLDASRSFCIYEKRFQKDISKALDKLFFVEAAEPEPFTLSPPILKKQFIKSILDNSLGFLKQAKKLSKYNIGVCRGLIFRGKPGNGKTLLCRYIKALAQHKGYAVASYDNEDFTTQMSRSSMKHVFNSGQIVILDDIDSIYFKNREKGGKPNDILGAMDGFHRNNSIIIFTFNDELTDIDPAFLRSGRIDGIYNFETPSKVLVDRFIDTWNLDFEIDIPLIKTRCLGMDFCDIEGVRKNLIVNHVLKQGKTDEQIVAEMYDKKNCVAYSSESESLNDDDDDEYDLDYEDVWE